MRGFWLPLPLLLLVGCYDPPDETERFAQSIVITTRDEDTDFAAFGTFFLRPEIRVIAEQETIDPSPGEPEFIPEAVAEPLLAETRRNLIARGYVETDDMTAADLAVESIYLRAVYTQYYCYYWWDWFYWGYPGYSYYYPGACSASTWQSGMLVTNAVDLMDATPPATEDSDDGLLQGVWYSGVYGAELESVSYIADRAVAGIRQSFVQSPYFTALP
jgi:uncharacterized protein DUF4136